MSTASPAPVVDRGPPSPSAAQQVRSEWGLDCRRRPEDGLYGVRFRVPGAELVFEQAREVASIARTAGGTIEVTRRGLLGLDGFSAADLPGVAARLDAVGLVPGGTGPGDVLTHPWSGLDPEEQLDTRALAWRLAEVVRAEEFACDVMIDGREAPSSACWSYDMAFLASAGPEGGTAFHWLIGGVRGPHPRPARKFPVWVEEGQVPDVVRHILAMARRHGQGAAPRLGRLVGRFGCDALLERVEEALGAVLTRNDRPVAGLGRDDDAPGWFAQKQPGRWAMALGVLPARLTPERLEALAALAGRHGDATLRTAPGRRIVVPNIPADRREAVVAALAGLGLAADPGTIPARPRYGRHDRIG
jgi:sulfite reductase beta subunit-like hemoprotein